MAVESSTGIAQGSESLLQLDDLVSRRGDARCFDDAEDDVIERIDVAIERQHIADRSRSGIGVLKELRQLVL